MRLQFYTVVFLSILPSLGFVPHDLDDYDLFMNFGPLCTTKDYMKCHDEAREKILQCSPDDTFCYCYYIGVVRDQCIKFCSNYHHETRFRLSRLCLKTGKTLKKNETERNGSNLLIASSTSDEIIMGAKSSTPVKSLSKMKRDYSAAIPEKSTSYTNIASSRVIRKGPHIGSQNVVFSIVLVMLLVVYLS